MKDPTPTLIPPNLPIYSIIETPDEHMVKWGKRASNIAVETGKSLLNCFFQYQKYTTQQKNNHNLRGKKSSLNKSNIESHKDTLSLKDKKQQNMS